MPLTLSDLSGEVGKAKGHLHLKDEQQQNSTFHNGNGIHPTRINLARELVDSRPETSLVFFTSPAPNDPLLYITSTQRPPSLHHQHPKTTHVHITTTQRPPFFTSPPPQRPPMFTSPATQRPALFTSSTPNDHPCSHHHHPTTTLVHITTTQRPPRPFLTSPPTNDLLPPSHHQSPPPKNPLVHITPLNDPPPSTSPPPKDPRPSPSPPPDVCIPSFSVTALPSQHWPHVHHLVRESKHLVA